MATFTISLPEELKKRIDEHPEINWAEYLKKRFEQRIKELVKFEELKGKKVPDVIYTDPATEKQVGDALNEMKREESISDILYIRDLME